MGTSSARQDRGSGPRHCSLGRVGGTRWGTGVPMRQAWTARPLPDAHPSTAAGGSTDITHYRALAQLAERGMFDLFFIA